MLLGDLTFETRLRDVSPIPTIQDIETYLEMRLARDLTPSAMDENLRTGIMKVIPRRILKMCVETTTLINLGLLRYSLTTEYRFLLASLNVDAVLEEVTIRLRKRRLHGMIQGKGLGCLFGNPGTNKGPEGKQVEARHEGTNVGITFGATI